MFSVPAIGCAFAALEHDMAGMDARRPARRRTERSRVAAYHKHGVDPSDPKYVRAQRDLLSAKTLDYIDDVLDASPTLTDAQRKACAVALWPPFAEALPKRRASA